MINATPTWADNAEKLGYYLDADKRPCRLPLTDREQEQREQEQRDEDREHEKALSDGRPGITHYIVQCASARCPAKFGTYRRVAVLEVSKGFKTVSMISERARGVTRIVQTWERVNVGKTKACAYERAYAEAKELCEELNRGAS
jgi:hypothetical protein